MIKRVGVAVPIDMPCALRDLVRDLAVGALVFREKAQCAVPHELRLSGTGHRERIDRGVAAEIPSEARTIAGATVQAIAGNEPATEIGIADHGFVEIDLRVFHCAIEQRIRRMQRQHRGAQRVGMFNAPVPFAFGGARCKQRSVECEGGVARHLSAGQHDRDVRDVRIDVAARRLAESWRRVALHAAADTEHELRRRGGQYVRGHVRRLSDGGRAEECVDAAFRLGEEKGARRLIPDQILPAECRRPREMNIRCEFRDDVERTDCIDFEQHHDRVAMEATTASATACGLRSIGG